MTVLTLLIIGIIIAVITATTTIITGVWIATVMTVCSALYVLWMIIDDDGIEGLGAFILGIVATALSWIGVAFGALFLGLFT